MLKIELTEEQKALLEDYFDRVRRGNKVGIQTAIAGQVWEDGIVVKIVTGDGGRALSEALGGNWDRVHRTAHSRMREEPHNAALTERGDGK